MLTKKNNAIERSRLSAAPFQVKLSITVIRRWDAVWTGWISSAENQHKIDCCWKTTPEHTHTHKHPPTLWCEKRQIEIWQKCLANEKIPRGGLSLSLSPTLQESFQTSHVRVWTCVCVLCVHVKVKFKFDRTDMKWAVPTSARVAIQAATTTTTSSTMATNVDVLHRKRADAVGSNPGMVMCTVKKILLKK